MSYKFGKLIDNKLIYAPNIIEEGGRVIFNPINQTYIDFNYKNIVHFGYPDAGIDDIITEVYTEDDNNIYVTYNVSKCIMNNDILEDKRKMAYQSKINQELLPTFNMYNLIGDTEKAQIIKQKIIDTVNDIRLMYPYI